MDNGKGPAYRVDVMKRHGFKNAMVKFPSLGEYPEDAPLGSVVVAYDPRNPRNPCDVQIRTEHGWVGDMYYPTAYTHQSSTGRNCKVLGVMVKDDSGTL